MLFDGACSELVRPELIADVQRPDLVSEIVCRVDG
jgi:hypothetical protein